MTLLLIGRLPRLEDVANLLSMPSGEEFHKNAGQRKQIMKATDLCKKQFSVMVEKIMEWKEALER